MRTAVRSRKDRAHLRVLWPEVCEGVVNTWEAWRESCVLGGSEVLVTAGGQWDRSEEGSVEREFASVGWRGSGGGGAGPGDVQSGGVTRGCQRTWAAGGARLQRGDGPCCPPRPTEQHGAMLAGPLLGAHGRGGLLGPHLHSASGILQPGA